MSVTVMQCDTWRIYEFLLTQHGTFRKHRSCETQLILTVDDLSRRLDNSEQVDAILLDVSKAFNKVPHRHLYSTSWIITVAEAQ